LSNTSIKLTVLRNIHFDETGSLRVRNISAYWLPKLTVVEKIGNTTYTVTGSYDGEGDFVRKLERIAAQKILVERGNSDDGERKVC